MALGVPGTGPYGRIRDLRQIIKSCEYEIYLIDEGINKGQKSGFQKRIDENRAEIRKIKEKIKKGEKFPD